jgi:hypothetical protein
MARPSPPYVPGHGGYVSEFDQFLTGFLDEHPEVPENQRRGWYIFWDHNVDLAELDRAQKDKLPTHPYIYD